MSNIPFRVKRLTPTAKLPHRNCESDLWDLFADDFCALFICDERDSVIKDFALSKKVVDQASFASMGTIKNITSVETTIVKRRLGERIDYLGSSIENLKLVLYPQGRILVKTGIALELPQDIYASCPDGGGVRGWFYDFEKEMVKRKDYTDWKKEVQRYAVADIRPRSGLALKHGITVLNSPGTIDNSYRKEIGVILYNAGHEPYTITKGDKIAQMLIRPLYPSSFEEVKDFEDTGRGGFGSTGK